MGRLLLRRLAQAALVIAGVVVLTFVIARLLPGDPAVAYAGPRASEVELARARELLRLDDPLGVQVAAYTQGLLQGDWGTSVRTRQPVLADLARVLPASLELVGLAMLVAVPVGVALGALAALAANARRAPTDVTVRLGSMLAVSFPVFWLALLLQLTLASRFGWFPVAGRGPDPLGPTGLVTLDAVLGGEPARLGPALRHLALPALALAAYPLGVVAQLTRAGLVEELRLEHVQLARALGFSRAAVIRRIALRPAASPVVALIALVFAYSLVNAFLVEAIFNWPGLGRYAADAIRSLDTPAIAGVTLIVALIYVLLNLVVDLVQAAIDPRVRAR